MGVSHHKKLSHINKHTFQHKQSFQNIKSKSITIFFHHLEIKKHKCFKEVKDVSFTKPHILINPKDRDKHHIHGILKHLTV